MTADDNATTLQQFHSGMGQDGEESTNFVSLSQGPMTSTSKLSSALSTTFVSIHISIYIHIQIFIRPYCYLYFPVDFSFLELVFYLNLLHQPDRSQAHLRRMPLSRGGDLISCLFRFTSIHSSRCSGVCENEEMA